MDIRFSNDLLRHIFVFSARTDKRTAVKLALVSRSAQLWIYDYLYEEVNVHNQRVAVSFLWTLERSRRLPQAFYANTVKSLVISPDVRVPHVLAILSVCVSVKWLTYWPLAERMSLPAPGSPAMVHGRLDSSRLLRLSVLRPRHLSANLHEHHSIPLFQPVFNSPFFQEVTHLSINNLWEQWTTFAFKMTAFDLPNLTHAKFDFIVGPAPPSQNAHQRRSELFGISISNSASAGLLPPVEGKHPRLMSKVEIVADSVSTVLYHHFNLQVCVLVLRFDNDPISTSSTISRLVSDWTYGAEEDELSFKPGFEPRLVLFWEKEPFRANYAHSLKEKKLWRASEAVVKAQTSLGVLDHILIDSNDLDNPNLTGGSGRL
ncbi:hypothetical protein CPB83DRAFT_73439 [Crepidotus variabilis]|uniref:Uncharacterized protein n=1 Tax=Crepidotus variabilis TaxID=179855 RepID=A0A9P6E5G7_9AGAR|nr:hypothetical protein CPB83DRAFT_73439 [Crepidotus variabilis]